MSSDMVYRPAGLLESYHIARQDLKLDTNVLVGGQFVNTRTNDQTRLTRETIYLALVHALRTHAALSVRVVRTSNNAGSNRKSKPGYVFERLETVNLEKSVRFLDEKDVDTPRMEDEEVVAKVIENEFTQPILSDSGLDIPLWRLTITPQNIVLFAWHHCIGDGQSGLAFLRTFLEGLNISTPSQSQSHSLPSDFDPKAVKTPSDLQLTPPIETLTDLSVSFRTLLSSLAGLFIPISWTSARHTWTANPISTAPNPFHTRARLLCIPPRRSAGILAAAREHGTTLTAVLYVLVVEVLSMLLKSDMRNAKYKQLSVIVPISLRHLANVSPTTMAELVSSYKAPSHLPSPPSKSIPNSKSEIKLDWPRAVSFSAKLRSSIPKSRETIGSLKYLHGQYERYFKNKLGKKRGVSMELSNAGAFKAHLSSDKRANSEWMITDAYFAQDDGIVGSALKVNCVGSPSGSVNICVTWGEGVVDDAFADAFVHDLGAAIENFHSHLMTEEKMN